MTKEVFEQLKKNIILERILLYYKKEYVFYSQCNHDIHTQRICLPVMYTIYMLVGLQLRMQSVPITTDIVRSNLDQGKVYNIM